MLRVIGWSRIRFPWERGRERRALEEARRLLRIAMEH